MRGEGWHLQVSQLLRDPSAGEETTRAGLGNAPSCRAGNAAGLSVACAQQRPLLAEELGVRGGGSAAPTGSTQGVPLSSPPRQSGKGLEPLTPGWAHRWEGEKGLRAPKGHEKAPKSPGSLC